MGKLGLLQKNFERGRQGACGLTALPPSPQEAFVTTSLIPRLPLGDANFIEAPASKPGKTGAWE